MPPSRSRVDPGSRRVIVAPLIHPEHLARVEGFVERAVRDGARILLGGRRAVEVGDLSAPRVSEPPVPPRSEQGAPNQLRSLSVVHTTRATQGATMLATASQHPVQVRMHHLCLQTDCLDGWLIGPKQQNCRAVPPQNRHVFSREFAGRQVVSPAVVTQKVLRVALATRRTSTLLTCQCYSIIMLVADRRSQNQRTGTCAPAKQRPGRIPSSRLK